MKKQSTMYAAKVFLIIAASFSFLANGSSESKAANLPGDSLTPVQIRYEGSKQDLLTFSVDYANPEGKSFVLEVLNDQNDVLFRHSYNAKNFTKKIYLLKTNEHALVSFGIRTGKEVVKESFSIRPETKVVEDLIVKRL